MLYGFAAVFMFVAAAGALAHEDDDHETAAHLQRKGEIASLDDIMDSVKRRFPKARILEAELERKRGRYIYEIEILTKNGRILEVYVDARKKKIIKIERD